MSVAAAYARYLSLCVDRCVAWLVELAVPTTSRLRSRNSSVVVRL